MAKYLAFSVSFMLGLVVATSTFNGPSNASDNASDNDSGTVAASSRASDTDAQMIKLLHRSASLASLPQNTVAVN